MKATVIRSLVIFVSIMALGMVALSPHYYAHAQSGGDSSGGGGCCGGGMGGSVPATTAQLTCGEGTHQANGMCVPNSSSNSGSNSSGSNQQTQSPTTNTQSIRR